MGLQGATVSYYSTNPTYEDYSAGFRVAFIPEPSPAVLEIGVLLCELWCCRRAEQSRRSTFFPETLNPFFFICRYWDEREPCLTSHSFDLLALERRWCWWERLPKA